MEGVGFLEGFVASSGMLHVFQIRNAPAILPFVWISLYMLRILKKSRNKNKALLDNNDLEECEAFFLAY